MKCMKISMVDIKRLGFHGNGKEAPLLVCFVSQYQSLVYDVARLL